MRQSDVEHESREPQSRARIRDAALKLFAVHGFKGATVRGIAREAGVSPGRVQHHFPSKQALRDECDAYVYAFVRTALAKGAVGGAVTDVGFVAQTHRTVSLVVPYVAMSMVSDGATASRWFDEMAGLYHGILAGGDLGVALSDGEDLPAVVAVYTAMELGLAILARHVYRRLGADERDPRTTARIGRARLFLATERLIGEDLAASIREGLDRYLEAANRGGTHEH